MADPWRKVDELDFADDEQILTRVGTVMQPVNAQLFAQCHAQLADKYRAAGLIEWPELDEAIHAELPMMLAHLLGEHTRH